MGEVPAAATAAAAATLRRGRPLGEAAAPSCDAARQARSKERRLVLLAKDECLQHWG